MIPQHLSVRNFLCYRENVPTLDFQGIHVACLCGQNGHGKSALLDAVTWCLWGEARGKTQDDLISYGADECRVELEFLSRDTSYRVIRSRSRAGGRRRQGVSDLQFQVLGSDAAIAITGDHIRETQAKIEQTIGMDYDAFINSAFLLQGRADEFTNKTPADRKAVLSKILGLEAYARIQERARQRLDEGKSSSSEIEGSLGRMRSDLENIGDPAIELAEVKMRLDDVNRQTEESRGRVEGLRAQVGELDSLRESLTELGVNITGIRSDIEQLESALSASQRRLRGYLDLIQEADPIRQGSERLILARNRLETLEEARGRYDQLGESKNQLQSSIDTSRTLLEAKIAQLVRRVHVELGPKAGAETELAGQLAQVQQRLNGLDQEKVQVAGLRDRLTKTSTAIGEAQGTAERYLVEGKELAAKLEFLEKSGGGEAVCPLCQTSLGHDGCTALSHTYTTDIQAKRNLYRQNQQRLKQLETEKKDMEQEWGQRDQALTTSLREGQSKLQELESRIQESREAQKTLDEERKQVQAAQSSLASGDFASAEQSELKAIEDQIQSLGYDDEARQQSYAETRELAHFEERQGQLTQAEASLPAEQESLARTQDILNRRRIDLEQAQERRTTGEQSISELPQLQTGLKAAESGLAELESTRQTTTARLGYLDGEVRRLQSLRREVSRDSARLAALKEDEGIYQELVTAFGRQGIQAMLIETVVPRLEEEANLLLGRMTDNRMQVKLETQRERRSGRGDPIETLEINVSDELGPRSYEMYSGGEAFRVNLSLRIALSKVLAQRMGAPLPTLFIDEGFGSQDAAGRERILDVISAIENDFDKIIVVTHLDDMKDVFPVRIEVQKGDDGSTFWIS
ncbi:MAG: SMC family ATPase [Dehalococcoidia bacterium]|nr:SMC family ATPase [Dehalococcoidia bacterium]